MKLDRSAAARLGRELAVLGALSLLLWSLFSHGVYPLLGLPSRAPIPLRSLILVLAIWLFTRRHGESWSDLGLSRPPRLWPVPLLALAFLVTKLLVVQPLSDRATAAFELAEPDLSFFDHLYQNPFALVVWLALAWIAGGFAEEFIFRGYLTNRIVEMLGDSPLGWTTALLGQATLFGLGHFYLGAAGIVSASISAVFFGIFFLVAGRNLWPVILAHGAWDSLAFVLIYANGAPTTA